MINNQELLLVVDEFDVPHKPMTRTETHSGGHWHRAAHVWVVNDQGQLLAQKRSMQKSEGPGLWEPYVAGHINWAEDYFAGAVKEVREETGLPVAKKDLKLIKIYQSEDHKEFRAVFYVKHKSHMGEVIPEPEEVDAVQWISIDEFGKTLHKRSDSEWIRTGYETEILPILTMG